MLPDSDSDRDKLRLRKEDILGRQKDKHTMATTYFMRPQSSLYQNQAKKMQINKITGEYH